ncbi:hypothetical protein K438DRAFT_2024048 [Mycena galopus ATCC 62051]|nr:hypothetical protein K438DRAFT_2024048 [Mycena galopus ATCC 62051]
MGVEVYPGCAGAKFLLSPSPDAEDAQGRKRTKGPRFEPSIAFRARGTLLAEATRSLSKRAAAMYDLGCADRTKHHPHFRVLLAGGTRLVHGARALTDSRLQSLPRLDVQDGALVAWTGMLAAEAAFAIPASPEILRVPRCMQNWTAEKSHPTGAEKEENNQTAADASLLLAPYAASFPHSPAHANLWAGSMVPWTLKDHAKSETNPSTTSSDALATLPASSFSPIQYPVFERL